MHERYRQTTDRWVTAYIERERSRSLKTDWRKINMNLEEKIKRTYKEVTENSDTSSKNLKSELKNKLRRRQNIVEKSQSHSKKFDTIDVRI